MPLVQCGALRGLRTSTRGARRAMLVGHLAGFFELAELIREAALQADANGKAPMPGSGGSFATRARWLGLAWWALPSARLTPAAMSAAVDAALYEAKRAGRDRVVMRRFQRGEGEGAAAERSAW